MGKRSQKQPTLSEKENSGCLSGLISVFDFRRGHYTQKLLSDRKCGSGGHHLETGYARSKLDFPGNIEIKDGDLNDADESGRKRDNLGMESVKRLMEKEMSTTQTKKVSSGEVELAQSDLGFELPKKKNHERTSKKHNLVSNIHDKELRANLKTSQSNYIDPMERSSLNFDFVTFMVELYGDDNHHSQENHLDPTIDLRPPSQTISDIMHKHFDEAEYQIAENHSSLYKALAEIAKVFLSQNFIDPKQLINNEAAQSKEFIDAVDILNSNKELFMKLIQDPDSLVMRYIQDLKNAKIGRELLVERIGNSGQCGESVNHDLIQKQARYSFFRKKDKSKGAKPSKRSDSSQVTNQIVVLKPSPAKIQNDSSMLSPSSSPRSHLRWKLKGDREQVASHFSLKGITRRLRHVSGENKKDQHPISMDGILHKVPYGFKDSGNMGNVIGRESLGSGLASKTFCNTEHASESPVIVKKTDKNAKPKEGPNISDDKRLNIIPAAQPSSRESFSYEEAKKHLAEMLTSGGKTCSLPTKLSSKSLGRILSLPEYNVSSPRFSPGRDKELNLSCQQTRFSPFPHLNQENASDSSSPLKQGEESPSCTDGTLDIQTQVIDYNPETIGEDLKPKDSMEIIEVESFISIEDCNNFTITSESIGYPNVIHERCKEEGSSLLILPGASEEKPQLVIPSRSPEGVMEKLDRSSPVSVLEPFFLDDASSPESTTTTDHDLHLQPQKIYFEEQDSSEIVITLADSAVKPATCSGDNEAMFDYIKTLLEESGLSSNEVSERWHSSNQLLNPSLFDEVGISKSPLPDDPKLLFDCINEVLSEIKERLFCCTFFVSLIKPSAQLIPRGGNLTKELCNGIDKHLHPQFPATLNQIVGKDMDQGNWMDLRLDTETVVIEMGDAILEETMAEAMFELWL